MLCAMALMVERICHRACGLMVSLAAWWFLLPGGSVAAATTNAFWQVVVAVSSPAASPQLSSLPILLSRCRAVPRR